MSEQETQRSAIVFVAVIGAIGNVLLAAAKVAVGVLGNSQALVADGVHSLSDLVTDAAVVLGAKFWTAPPDASHPYGHGRLETLVNLFIGLVLAATAVGIGWKGVSTIGASHSTQLGWSAFAVSLGSVIIKETMFRWTVRRGRAIGSSALVANAWHHRSDAMSSLPVLLAVVVGWFAPNLTILDHLAALAVAALLLKAAWDIMKPVVLELMEAREPALATDVHDAVEARDEIHAVYDVRSRRVGGAVFVDLKMIVDPSMSIAAVHTLQHELERRIRDRHPAVLELLTHVEPGVAHARPSLAK